MKKLIPVLLFVPLISFGQTSFLEKYENSLWTNGYLTLRFVDINSMELKESKENNQEYFIVYDSIQNLKNIYEINTKNVLKIGKSQSLYGEKVDFLNQESAIESGTLECEMCGYSVMLINSIDTLSFSNNYSDDFGGYSIESSTFFLENKELINTKEYKIDELRVPSVKFNWIPVDSDSVYLNEVRKKNQMKLDLYIAQKDSVTRLYESQIEMDFY
ncbi:MAG: hypothetical protein P8K14_01585 [Flavobacteriaceae bacterium]|nr:hypothetical protein [Flavobacteriaceae bacterium]